MMCLEVANVSTINKVDDDNGVYNDDTDRNETDSGIKEQLLRNRVKKTKQLSRLCFPHQSY